MNMSLTPPLILSVVSIYTSNRPNVQQFSTTNRRHLSFVWKIIKPNDVFAANSQYQPRFALIAAISIVSHYSKYPKTSGYTRRSKVISTPCTH